MSKSIKPKRNLMEQQQQMQTQIPVPPEFQQAIQELQARQQTVNLAMRDYQIESNKVMVALLQKVNALQLPKPKTLAQPKV